MDLEQNRVCSLARREAHRVTLLCAGITSTTLGCNPSLKVGADVPTRVLLLQLEEKPVDAAV